MFINLTNHPSSKWGKEQIGAAKEYGEIIDIAFPRIDPRENSEAIDKKVDMYFEAVRNFPTAPSLVVLVQGEFIFTYRMVEKLRAAGIKAVSSCCERRVREYIDEAGKTQKTAEFEFAGFKPYW